MNETAPTASTSASELFESHRHVAVRLAGRYRAKSPPWVSHDDLFQECKIALLRASKGFDTRRGIVFSSYATVIVARAARAFIRREYRQGFSGIGTTGTADDFRLRSRRVDGGEVAELVTDAQPLRVMWNKERWDLILKCLSTRERRVLELRLFEELTNRQVGEVLGCGPSRVNFLWKSAIKRIKFNAIHTVDTV